MQDWMRALDNIKISYMLEGLSEISALIFKDRLVIIVTMETQDLQLLWDELRCLLEYHRFAQVI